MSQTPQGPYNNDQQQKPYQPYQPYQYTQPPQGYQMPPGYQQPVYQQPVLPQAKKKAKWPIFAGVGCLIVAVIICGVSVISGAFTAKSAQTSIDQSASTGRTTSSNTTPGKWTTVQTFTGEGAKKTGTFSVPDDWKLVYNCQGMDIGGITNDANLSVSVDNTDGSMLDPVAINTICKAGKTSSDTTEEHQGGQVYLDVNADASWTIEIQEMK